MIDLPSLLVLAGLLFGLVAGNAALYGDTLRVQIAVPEALNKSGFTEASAEAVFLAEAARIVRGDSIIPAPSLRVHANTSVITALAKPLSLDGVVTAMQSEFGIDNLTVSCAILAEVATGKSTPPDAVRPLTAGTRLDMIIVVEQPTRPPTQTVLEQPDGNATMLVKRAAGWAMEQVTPYRVVLAHALAGLEGDKEGFVLARVAAQRFLSKTWEPSQASEVALTHNVVALLDLMDDKIADADAELALSDAIPDVLPQARAQIAINQSFIAVARKQPRQAAELLKRSRQHAAAINLPEFALHQDIQEALVAWAGGDTQAAEDKLRAVIAALPESETGHHYLALLAREKGDGKTAAAEETAEQISHRFEHRPQGLAVLLFWTDPVKGGIYRRT